MILQVIHLFVLVLDLNWDERQRLQIELPGLFQLHHQFPYFFQMVLLGLVGLDLFANLALEGPQLGEQQQVVFLQYFEVKLYFFEVPEQLLIEEDYFLLEVLY